MSLSIDNSVMDRFGKLIRCNGRVAGRSYPLRALPAPDVPDYGIRLLRTIDSLRFQRAMHDLQGQSSDMPWGSG